MNVKVLFHSMTGNTRKIAEAIAKEVGVCAEEISNDISSETIDILFLGDGNYGSSIYSTTKEYIAKLSSQNVKNVAVFGTYGGKNNALPKLKALLKENGLNVFDVDFSCKGKAWAVFNRKHPDDTDISKAKEFARKVIQECQSNI